MSKKNCLLKIGFERKQSQFDSSVADLKAYFRPVKFNLASVCSTQARSHVIVKIINVIFIVKNLSPDSSPSGLFAINLTPSTQSQGEYL